MSSNLLCRYSILVEYIYNGSIFFGFQGLPVTIAHAGLVPFLVSFLVGFFVQVSNIWAQLSFLKDWRVLWKEPVKYYNEKLVEMKQHFLDRGYSEDSVSGGGLCLLVKNKI